MRCNSPVVALTLLAACSGGSETRSATSAPTPSLVRYGSYDTVGLASWYGEELAGRLTASGAHFDPSAITAAHRTLPLNSFVEVTSLDTGRSILALVNDRGPGRRDREIDLSRAAAKMLGVDHNPLAAVRVRGLARESDAVASLQAGTRSSGRLALDRSQLANQRGRMPVLSATAPIPVAAAIPDEGPYAVQVAAFSNRDRALALAKVLDGEALAINGVWRVRVGPFDKLRAAQRARDDAAQRGYGDARITSFE